MTQMLAPILPLYIETFTSATKRPESLTGIFVGITQLIAGLSAIFYGRLGDRFGYSKILVISLVATGLATIPQAFASSITVLFIERCLTGLAIGGLIPSVNALVSRIIPRDKIGSAYGLTSAVTCLGIGMGPFIGGIMASFAGLRFPFAFMGFSAFVIAFVTQRSIKRSGLGNGSS
jgi:DHA1 family multidrug resistance protein-like MFS transporter